MDSVCSFSLSRVVFISLSVFSLFSGSGLPPASPNQKPVRVDPNPITPHEKAVWPAYHVGSHVPNFHPRSFAYIITPSAFHVDGAFVKEVIYFGNYSIFSLEICKVLY